MLTSLSRGPRGRLGGAHPRENERRARLMDRSRLASRQARGCGRRCAEGQEDVAGAQAREGPVRRAGVPVAVAEQVSVAADAVPVHARSSVAAAGVPTALSRGRPTQEPRISLSAPATSRRRQWIVTAYALAFGSLLLLGAGEEAQGQGEDGEEEEEEEAEGRQAPQDRLTRQRQEDQEASGSLCRARFGARAAQWQGVVSVIACQGTSRSGASRS